ncbi:MAG: beta-galactosidase trimerization domain-containing protein [Terriglobia bacterium]
MHGFIERGQEVLQVENQGRGPNTSLWQIGMTGKLLRALSGGKRPYWITIGYYLPGWRHIAKPEAEQRVWLAEALANGARPWFHVVGAAQEDQRGFKAFEDFFSFHQKNQRAFQSLNSRADVALVYSQATLDFYRLSSEATPLGAPPAMAESVRGAYQALLESRTPFDMLLEEDLAKSLPGRYRVVVLPNVAMLSGESAKAIREFVRLGGGLVATFETSLYDETGTRLQDFALHDLLGAHAISERVLGPLGHSYMRIENEKLLGEEFAGTAVLPNTRYRVPVKAEGAAETPLSLIPAYPVYPPETSWTQTENRDVALAYFRVEGKGCVAYFPGDLAATFGASHLPDHGRLLERAIRWVRRDQTSPSVSGAGLVDFAIYESEQGRRLVAFLVNLTNPAAWRPPLTEIIPAGKQVISIPIRPGQQCRSVRLLVDEREGEFSQSGDTLQVTVPNLRDFEVALVDLK